jgi:hypothetical protein
MRFESEEEMRSEWADWHCIRDPLFLDSSTNVAGEEEQKEDVD